ncbi:MAG: hypothetical protein AAFY60_03835, partial [Myxococcota bacterium]
LVIELESASRGSTSHLILLGTTSIQITTSWRISELTLEPEADFIVLRDTGLAVTVAREAQFRDPSAK